MHVIYFFCPGVPLRSVRESYDAAVAPLGDVSIVWITPAGLSSVFRREAYKYKAGGRVIPGLLQHNPPPGNARPTSISLVGFSAGYGFIIEALRSLDDRSAVDAVVLLDGLHSNYDNDGTPSDTMLAPVTEYASAAAAGVCSFTFCHTDVSTYRAYASTTETADEIARLAPLRESNWIDDCEGFNHRVRYNDGCAQIRAYDLYDAKRAKSEHGAALNIWGPSVLAHRLVPYLSGGSIGPSPAVPVATPDPTPHLKRGDHGLAVEDAQQRLVSAGVSLGRWGADGSFGAATQAAVKDYQRTRDLAQTGEMDAPTWAALLAQAPPIVRGNPQPVTLTAQGETFGNFKFKPRPTAGNPGGIEILGKWTREHIVSVSVPELDAIPGVMSGGTLVGSGPKSVLVHRLAAEPLRALFSRWGEAGLLDRVLVWSGMWNPRMIRGGHTLSRHAWGTAFDINAPWNALGATPAASGKRGSVLDLLPIARELGWAWGGEFSRPDGMHFELTPEGVNRG